MTFSSTPRATAVLLVGILATVASVAVAAQNEPLDFSCATFHAFISEAELVTKYGRENVSTGPVVGSDDGPVQGTILFAAQDDMRVEIVWHDVKEKRGPSWIRVRGNRSNWIAPNGLRLGDDLLAIEKRNGWPFTLAGFSSEGQGGLLDWKAGRLATIPNCDIRPTFQPREGVAVSSSIRQVTSLPSVSSGHPVMQQINPVVVALWIRHPLPRSPQKPEDSILDVLVFGVHVPINPALYNGQLRDEVEQYLRRAGAYVSTRMSASPSGELKMVLSAQLSYETRLASISGDARASTLAQSYVTRLRPCYEWEGFHDCPEAEAEFADKYQADNPGNPFSEYLPLLSAHRWLCAAEGYEYEKKPVDAARSRSLYEQRLAVARQSKVLLIRTAAERLAERGRCLPSR